MMILRRCVAAFTKCFPPVPTGSAQSVSFQIEEDGMKKSLFKMLSLIAILALMLVAMPVRSAQAISPDIVISQVYGGGGNSGGIYTNDFVELFNRGTTTVSLTGWSIQYTSATGTGNF